MRFGREDCSSIEVESFRAICGYGPVDPTKPLELDVPGIAFVPPIPPNECACFTFKKSKQQGSGQVRVTDCGTEPKCTVTIQQASQDCCSGEYSVFAHVDVPCMPFDVQKPTVKVRNRSGKPERGVDGAAAMSVEKDCCELATELKLTLPDCIKPYDKLENPRQLTFYDHGNQVAKRLVSMKEDPDNCTVYPQVHPIEIPPCTLPNAVKSGSFSVVKGQKVQWELTRKDCDMSISFKANPISICVPEIRTEEVDTKVQFQDKEITHRVRIINKAEQDECPIYEIKSAAINLDPLICIPEPTVQVKPVSIIYPDKSTATLRPSVEKTGECPNYKYDVDLGGPIDFGGVCIPGLDVEVVEQDDIEVALVGWVPASEDKPELKATIPPGELKRREYCTLKISKRTLPKNTAEEIATGLSLRAITGITGSAKTGTINVELSTDEHGDRSVRVTKPESWQDVAISASIADNCQLGDGSFALDAECFYDAGMWRVSVKCDHSNIEDPNAEDCECPNNVLSYNLDAQKVTLDLKKIIPQVKVQGCFGEQSPSDDTGKVILKWKNPEGEQQEQKYCVTFSEEYNPETKTVTHSLDPITIDIPKPIYKGECGNECTPPSNPFLLDPLAYNHKREDYKVVMNKITWARNRGHSYEGVPPSGTPEELILPVVIGFDQDTNAPLYAFLHFLSSGALLTAFTNFKTLDESVDTGDPGEPEIQRDCEEPT